MPANEDGQKVRWRRRRHCWRMRFQRPGLSVRSTPIIPVEDEWLRWAFMQETLTFSFARLSNVILSRFLLFQWFRVHGVEACFVLGFGSISACSWMWSATALWSHCSCLILESYSISLQLNFFLWRVQQLNCGCFHAKTLVQFCSVSSIVWGSSMRFYSLLVHLLCWFRV